MLLKMNSIRTIVKDAFKIDELKNNYWSRVYVEDGLLLNGTIEEVNEKFNDGFIIDEVLNLLDVYNCKDELDYEDKIIRNDLKQIKQFLIKYNK